MAYKQGLLTTYKSWDDPSRWNFRFLNSFILVDSDAKMDGTWGAPKQGFCTPPIGGCWYKKMLISFIFNAIHMLKACTSCIIPPPHFTTPWTTILTHQVAISNSPCAAACCKDGNLSLNANEFLVRSNFRSKIFPFLGGERIVLYQHNNYIKIARWDPFGVRKTAVKLE